MTGCAGIQSCVLSAWCGVRTIAGLHERNQQFSARRSRTCQSGTASYIFRELQIERLNGNAKHAHLLVCSVKADEHPAEGVGETKP